MIGKWNGALKIIALTMIESLIMSLVIYMALRDERDYFSLIVFILFALLLILGLFLKSNSQYRIFAWSLIWTATNYILFGVFAFLFLFTYGAHGVC